MNKELIEKITAFAQGNEELAMQTDSSFEFGIVAAYEYLQRQPMSNKQILKVLLKQNYDMLKEFVSDMVYYAHKAECQDTLSEEDFVIEQLKRRIADDEND